MDINHFNWLVVDDLSSPGLRGKAIAIILLLIKLLTIYFFNQALGLHNLDQLFY